MSISLESYGGGYSQGTENIPLQDTYSTGNLPLNAERQAPTDPALEEAPPPEYYRPHAELVGPLVGPVVGQVINVRI